MHCSNPLQRWGKTVAGRIRWYCITCKTSSVRKRIDITTRARYHLFCSWITGTQSITQIAHQAGGSRQTITTWFMSYWQYCPVPLRIVVPPDVLIIDGLYLERKDHCVLIGKTKTAVLHWVFTQRESYTSWRLFFSSLPQPRIVVCDGQRGMRLAIHTLWPETRIQRCVIHVYQLATGRLTKRPKTGAGQNLRILMHAVLKVRTRRQKRRWIRTYRCWKKQYERFLKERTIGTPLKSHCSRNLFSKKRL